jgi:hypothetical protein
MDYTMHHLKFVFVNCTLITLLCVPVAFANNSAAGLQPMLDPELQIEKQEVTINLDHITVSTTISNPTYRDISQTFVMPISMEISANDAKVDVHNNQTVISSSNNDVTAILKNLGVPFDPMHAMHVIDTSPNRDHIRNKLMSHHLLEKDHESPLWSVKNYYYWRQVFPAQSTVTVTQNYKPNVTSKAIKLVGNDGIIHMPWNAVKKIYNLTVHWTWKEPMSAKQLQTMFVKNNPQIETFCPTIKDFQEILGKEDNITEVKGSLETKQIVYQYLSEAINPSVIKNFTLKISTPSSMHPLLCWYGDVKAHGKNQIWYEATNYVPQQDLNILFVEKAQG